MSTATAEKVTKRKATKMSIVDKEETQTRLFSDELGEAVDRLSKLRIERSKVNEQIKEEREEIIRMMNEEKLKICEVELHDGESLVMTLYEALKSRKKIKK